MPYEALLATIDKKTYSKLTMQKIMLSYYKNAFGNKKDASRTLYRLCVESLQKSLIEIKTAIECNDYIGLYAALHKLKGVLGSTGFMELMDDADILCRYVKALGRGEIQNMSDEFISALERFKTPLLTLCEPKND